MKKIIYLTLLAFLFFVGCKKDPYINNSYQNPIFQGQIQFSLNTNVTLKQSIDALQSVNAPRYDLYDFCYTKIITPDSTSYTWHLFKSLNYITVFGMFQKPNDPFTQIRSLYFKNITPSIYAKWDSLVQQQHFIELPTSGDEIDRQGFLYIPNGQEKMWIDILNKLPQIKHADYIYVMEPVDG